MWGSAGRTAGSWWGSVWWTLGFYINPVQCSLWAPWQYTQFCFMADFYFKKSRHKWKICQVCSREEQLYGMCGLLILWVWSPLASSTWPGTALVQVKAHPRVHQLGFLLLCISVPSLCVTDQIPLEGELHYLVPLVIKIILNPVQLLVSGIISLVDALMHAVVACMFPSGHPSLPAWIVNSEKSLAQAGCRSPESTVIPVEYPQRMCR